MSSPPRPVNRPFSASDPKHWAPVLEDRFGNSGFFIVDTLARRTVASFDSRAERDQVLLGMQTLALLRAAAQPLLIAMAKRRDAPDTTALPDEQPFALHVTLGAARDFRRAHNFTGDEI